MASAWGDAWGSAWGDAWGSVSGVVPRPYPGAAGAPAKRGRQKRKKYVLDGQTLALTRDELEDALEALLTRPAEVEQAQPAKVKAKDAAIVAAFPAYPEVRDMLLAAQQIEAAQALRAVAQRLADDEDERDVEMLLLWG